MNPNTIDELRDKHVEALADRRDTLERIANSGTAFARNARAALEFIDEHDEDEQADGEEVTASA